MPTEKGNTTMNKTRKIARKYAQGTDVFQACRELRPTFVPNWVTMTRDELRPAAARRDIAGRGRMTKDELIVALTAVAQPAVVRPKVGV